MTNVPAAILERRAELGRCRKNNSQNIDTYQRDNIAIDAELAGIALTVAAYADCAASGEAGGNAARASRVGPYWTSESCGPGSAAYEAGAQVAAWGAMPGTPGAESAPAGEFEVVCPQCADVSAHTVMLSEYVCGQCDKPFSAVSESPSTKKPRAPKRDLQGAVLRHLERQKLAPTIPELAAYLEISESRTRLVVESLQRAGRVTLDGGVVPLRIRQPGPADDDGPTGTGDDRLPGTAEDWRSALPPVDAEAQQGEAAE